MKVWKKTNESVEGGKKTNLVEVPNLEHGFAIMKRVFKEAVFGGKSVRFTPENGSIGHG